MSPLTAVTRAIRDFLIPDGSVAPLLACDSALENRANQVWRATSGSLQVASVGRSPDRRPDSGASPKLKRSRAD